ncbi:hypothetical protein [uncultured Fibrobacter sp.]|uniref:hypothetical protein n=1 Tax=uncultured Fibrobacter sp. TaxID=261512 RepID=UPI002611BB8B|nr:hypothetical protein [uncultured Fibrobacter sp.]
MAANIEKLNEVDEEKNYPTKGNQVVEDEIPEGRAFIKRRAFRFFSHGPNLEISQRHLKRHSSHCDGRHKVPKNLQ